MKRGIAILSVLPFLAAACLQGAPGGAGAGLGSPAPFESGGMAGPPAGSSSMSGAVGGSGPSGGSGPGGDEEMGRGETPSDGPSDPTAGAETPSQRTNVAAMTVSPSLSASATALR